MISLCFSVGDDRSSNVGNIIMQSHCNLVAISMRLYAKVAHFFSLDVVLVVSSSLLWQ